jgi:steroid 5-alpha reductase family enzyme
LSPIAETLLSNLALIAAALTCVWLFSLPLKNASIADVAWGAGFVMTTWASLALAERSTSRTWLLVGLTTIWGVRLTVYLLWRGWGAPEDRRYAAIRRNTGPRFWLISLLTVFMLQGALMWFVSLPLQLAIAHGGTAPLGWLDFAGVLVWTIGFLFETVGDWQLAQFKRDPHSAGQVMDRGLWRLTRHPNYFGDFCAWWGLYLVAAAGGAGWMIASPLVMSGLLLKVSGTPLLERTIADRRPGYAAYQARTNAFFPGPPRD